MPQDLAIKNESNENMFYTYIMKLYRLYILNRKVKL